MTQRLMRLNSWPCLLSCSSISVFGEYLQESFSQATYNRRLIGVLARDFLTAYQSRPGPNEGLYQPSFANKPTRAGL